MTGKFSVRKKWDASQLMRVDYGTFEVAVNSVLSGEVRYTRGQTQFPYPVQSPKLD